jgi:hypothetical protein
MGGIPWINLWHNKRNIESIGKEEREEGEIKHNI